MLHRLSSLQQQKKSVVWPATSLLGLRPRSWLSKRAAVQSQLSARPPAGLLSNTAILVEEARRPVQVVDRSSHGTALLCRCAVLLQSDPKIDWLISARAARARGTRMDIGMCRWLADIHAEKKRRRHQGARLATRLLAQTAVLVVNAARSVSRLDAWSTVSLEPGVRALRLSIRPRLGLATKLRPCLLPRSSIRFERTTRFDVILSLRRGPRQAHRDPVGVQHGLAVWRKAQTR